MISTLNLDLKCVHMIAQLRSCSFKGPRNHQLRVLKSTAWFLLRTVHVIDCRSIQLRTGSLHTLYAILSFGPFLIFLIYRPILQISNF